MTYVTLVEPVENGMKRITLVSDCLQCGGQHAVDLRGGDAPEAIDSGPEKADECLGWADVFDGITRELATYRVYRKGFSPSKRDMPTVEAMKKAVRRNVLVL